MSLPTSLTAAPTGSDLQTFLEDAKLITSTLDENRLDHYIASAIREFKKRTGIQYLSGTSASLLFDPPCASNRGYVLQLGQPLLASAAPVVRTGYSPSSSGTTLTVNTEYILRPLNQGIDGFPYWEIEFLCSPGSSPRSVLVEGTWGLIADASWTADVWLGLLNGAAALLMADYKNDSAGAQKIKEGPVEIDMGPNGVSQIKRFENAFNNFCNSWIRI